jgi:eukaryotic-like serine/threonine-protein kinase
MSAGDHTAPVERPKSGDRDAAGAPPPDRGATPQAGQPPVPEGPAAGSPGAAATTPDIRPPADTTSAGGEAPPLELSADDEPLALPARVGRYLVEGVIAGGGMGVVLRARDPGLNRTLALKVLRRRYQGQPELVQRFLEEAQITGQLQHPGVPPVYEAGHLEDGQPFLAMKLIRGQTLDHLLKGRKGPSEELPRFLAAFSQVCQAVGYAHSRGVVHRDLKPANVMVGAFGEVQVMDWGLAKLLGGGGAGGEAEAGCLAPVRGAGEQTERGRVLGTFAYMAPEQARGEADTLDERADVFGLGAILCCILTGQPPYPGPGRDEVYRRAEAGDLGEAFARLGASGADGELVALAKACLSPKKEDRPRDAGELARAVAEYQAGVQERLRAAELERAAAQARAEEAKAKAHAERRARRLTAGLAATGLLTLVAVGGGWLWVAQDRAARERQALARRADAEQSVSMALGKAEQLKEQAGKVRPGTVAGAEQAIVLWKQAEGLVGQAEGVLASALGAEAARERLAERRQEVAAGLRRAEAAREQARKEAKLLADLDNARALRSNWRGSHFDYEAAARAYAKAVAAYGLDAFGPEPAAVAAAIRKERLAVRLALIVALDDWAFCARDKVRAPRLRQVAGLADDDGWRRRSRAAVAGGDLGELKRLAKEARAQPLPPVSLELLAVALGGRGARVEAAELLRPARGRHPEDFWIHLNLGTCLYGSLHADSGTLDEALGCYWAAVALRPGSAPARYNLGHALEDKGRLDEAIAEYRRAIEVDPKLVRAHNKLGTALRAKGRLEEALAAYRRAIEVDPKDANAHTNLGNALNDKGRLAEAIAEHVKAIKLDPKLALAHTNLGAALAAKGRLEEAIAEYRKAIDLDPKDARTHSNLGSALYAKGGLDQAIAEFRQAIDLDPKGAKAHSNLGNALRTKGRLDEALAECRKAIDLDPKFARAHTNLGAALEDKGRLDEALAASRRAIDLDPKDALARYNLGNALRAKGRLDEAITAYRQALDLDPKDAWAHTNLGDALYAKGALDEAIAEYRKAIDLDPKDAQTHGALGQALLQQGRFAEARNANRRALNLLPERHPLRALATQQFQVCERLLALDEKLPAILKGDARPADARERLQLADLCREYKKRYAAAARFYADAFTAEPKLADDLRFPHRYNAACAAALAAAGQGEDARLLPDKVVLMLRLRALRWLRADLDAYARLLQRGNPAAKRAVGQRLAHWQQDPDLASVRDEGALARLPADERAAWGKLWAEVDDLLKRVKRARAAK